MNTDPSKAPIYMDITDINRYYKNFRYQLPYESLCNH